jgi:hypothetical protein
MKLSLRLFEDSAEIGDICRAIECSMSSVPELAGLVVPVQLLDNFGDLPEAGRSQVVKDTYASYRRSTRTIYVNRSTFVSLPPEIQQAVIAHEIGHAYAHSESLVEKAAGYGTFGDYGEEFLADRLACIWGFSDGLRRERSASYGQRYIEALDLWRDEPAYLKEMHKWHWQKLGGVF